MKTIAIASLLAASVLLVAADPPATSPPGGDAQRAGRESAAAEEAVIRQAADAIHTGKPADAIVLVQQVIAAEEKAHHGETARSYCARSPAEALLYAAMAAKDHAAASVVAPSWCSAIFLQGFALIDLGRAEEAGGFLEKAVKMAPMNSHFLGELAEWYKNRKNWDQAYSLFEQASQDAAFSPESLRSFDKRRALRGMGFVLIERGKLDEAEKVFEQCLAINSADQGAKSELEYIRKQRKTARGDTA